jgi:hypothetical protein
LLKEKKKSNGELAMPLQNSRIVVWYAAFLFRMEGKAQKADK